MQNKKQLLFHYLIPLFMTLLFLSACSNAEPAPPADSAAPEPAGGQESAEQAEPAIPPEPTENPVFAPLGGGGRVVYWMQKEGGGTEMGIAWQDGTEAAIFTSEDYKYWFMGGYSPDGSLFCGPAKDNESALYIVNADGTDLRLVRDKPNTIYFNVTFAGDAEHILYSAGGDDGGPYQFYYGSVDGTEEIEIEVNIEQQTLPIWVTDGKIVYSGTYEGETDIYQVDMETGEITRLFETPDYDYFPSVSPDGKKLVWFTDTSFQIIVGDLETGTWKSIATGTSPLWAPDGGIIFHDYSILSYMNSDGTGITPLADIFPELMEFASEGIYLQP